MLPKIRFILLALIAVLVLAACSSLNVGATAATGQTAAENQPAAQPTSLLMGTIILEDTDQAVTPQQAKDLLPLWKAVKSLSSSDTASADEIAALYTQIEETMTAEQIRAIQSADLKPENLAALMEKLGIEMPQNPMGSLTEDERATRVAQRQAQGGGEMPAGGPGGGAMPRGGGEFAGGGPGGMMPPDGGGFAGGQGGVVSTTPQVNRGGRGGMNLMLVEPLIKLLEARAAE